MNFDRFKYLEKMIGKYASRIVEIHISGNDGSDDQHLPINKDDWQLEAVQMLSELPGLDGNGVDFTIEVRRIPLERIVSTVHLLENAVFKH